MLPITGRYIHISNALVFCIFIMNDKSLRKNFEFESELRISLG
jgi:hypothetical protein